MNLYILINPSDPITFYAEDDKIAVCAAIIVGNGQTGLRAVDEHEVPNTMLFLTTEEYQKKFIEEHIKPIMESQKDCDKVMLALKTFAVCSPSERKIYDDYTNNSENKEKAEIWDNEKRSSMNNFCGHAHAIANDNT